MITRVAIAVCAVVGAIILLWVLLTQVLDVGVKDNNDHRGAPVVALR